MLINYSQYLMCVICLDLLYFYLIILIYYYLSLKLKDNSNLL